MNVLWFVIQLFVLVFSCICVVSSRNYCNRIERLLLEKQHEKQDDNHMVLNKLNYLENEMKSLYVHMQQFINDR